MNVEPIIISVLVTIITSVVLFAVGWGRFDGKVSENGRQILEVKTQLKEYQEKQERIHREDMTRLTVAIEQISKTQQEQTSLYKLHDHRMAKLEDLTKEFQQFMREVQLSQNTNTAVMRELNETNKRILVLFQSREERMLATTNNKA